MLAAVAEFQSQTLNNVLGGLRLRVTALQCAVADALLAGKGKHGMSARAHHVSNSTQIISRETLSDRVNHIRTCSHAQKNSQLLRECC